VKALSKTALRRPMRARSDLPRHHCLFDTAIGPCGVAWTEQGLTRVQLPEADRDATERRLLHSGTGPAGGRPPPPAVRQAIDAIKRYAAGEKIDFGPVAVDLTGISTFHRKV
jgi:methylated-DNA-[protein]-cysteine S-methyltransferase